METFVAVYYAGQITDDASYVVGCFSTAELAEDGCQEDNGALGGIELTFSAGEAVTSGRGTYAIVPCLLDMPAA